MPDVYCTQTDHIWQSTAHVIQHASNEGGVDVRCNWLLGDFVCLLSAASEPVLCTLVFFFFHLAIKPREVLKLRLELVDVDDLSNDSILQNLSHLNGIINETLRLHPPVPSASLRDTLGEGLTIGCTYIPGNTTVFVPQYSVGRRDDCYEHAEEVIPERWYSRPEMVRDKTAFNSFGCENHMCIGRDLGLMEIRLAIALLVSKYDIDLAPGETGLDVSERTIDSFVATPSPLRLVFEKRQC